MPKVKSSFSIMVGSMPSWHPAWEAPGVITTIPNSSLRDAIQANGWTEPTDILPGGTSWPVGLYAYSGGTVAYVSGQPYLCICGGGHATHADNSIYAFGPLFGAGSSNPTWTRLGPQSRNEDIRTCTQHNADGRPTSRHTVGDFSYGNGRIVMLWKNSAYCANGGTQPGIDVFDVVAEEWDNAKSPRVTHSAHSLEQAIHSTSCYHPHTGLFYAKGKAGKNNSFGSYDPARKVFKNISFSGIGQSSDSLMCTMGPRDYIFYAKEQGTNAGRINVRTGVGQLWGGGFPGGAEAAIGYDSRLDRIYTPTTGISSNNQDMPAGAKTVAWLDASAGSNPSWQSLTFKGDTPDQQRAGGTYGRWSYVPELSGFVLNNAWDSSIYFYRTSQ